MAKLSGCSVFVALLLALTAQSANAVGERPYWPAYEYRQVPEGCIKWNWQQLSYYNYCGRVYPSRSGVPGVVRVRG